MIIYIPAKLIIKDYEPGENESYCVMTVQVTIRL